MRTLLTLILVAGTALADSWTDTFSIEKIPVPAGVDPQIGGIDATPSGKLAMCFHRGEILIYNPRGKTWKRFADGLHEPLGLVAESESSFLVMQRPELTRVADTDGDGTADRHAATVTTTSPRSRSRQRRRERYAATATIATTVASNVIAAHFR